MNDRNALSKLLDFIQDTHWDTMSKEVQEQKKIKQIQKDTIRKYLDKNNEYYSQEKNYYNLEESYKSYVEKNVLPYND